MSVCWCVRAYMYVCMHNYGYKCYIQLATVTPVQNMVLCN